MLKQKRNFTLVELIVAMGVFAILMAVLMQFFSSAQNLWTSSSAKTETFENARIAMDMISRDLQSMFYGESGPGHVPFYNNTEDHRLGIIAYTNSVPVSGDPNANIRIGKIQYWWDPDTGTTKNPNGYLRLWVVGSTAGSAWNFYDNCNDIATVFPAFPTTAPTDTDKQYVAEVIPYLVGFYITTYDKDGVLIVTSDPTVPPVAAGVRYNSSLYGSGAGDYAKAYQGFPYAIQIRMVLLSKGTFTKWKAMPAGTPKDAFLNNNGRSFTKRVLIGDRGQYDAN